MAMLNVSKSSETLQIETHKLKAFNKVEAKKSERVLIRLLSVTFLVFFIFLFIPWTQNIRAKGRVTALQPDQRPQAINSAIGGRIEKWFVQEGDFVKKGDTILFVSEIKDDYFDPNLLERTQEQLLAKEMSVKSYMEKVKAQDNQIDALLQTGKLKLEQAQNKLEQARLKIISDSTDYQAAIINFNIANEQLIRMEELYKEGLKSLTDLEGRKMALQKAQAQKISAENKLLTSRNEEINARVELISIQAQYRESIAKAESDKFTALSNMYDAEATVTKLQNQFMNYSIRLGLYYVTAPLDGYITKAIQSGIGEIIKEGDEIITIMPAYYDLAVEMFVKPIDYPLLERGQKVRIQFDGWPAIIFSGWPNTSYGTYGGQVFAVDNFTNEAGLFRVLVQPDPEDVTWPSALRVGGGADNMLLLKDVPIWYELWRQINGFPPDYYQTPGGGGVKMDKPKREKK